MKLISYILPGLLLALAGCGDKSSRTEKSAADTVIETIMSRRSVRKYLPRPVEREKMQTIVECGLNAPNGLNRQPWAVRIVDNAEYLDGVTDLFRQDNPAAAADPGFRDMFRNAPTVVFIASPEDGSGDVDCGLMGENMILAAWSMGIGSCCLGGPVAFMKSPAAAEYLARLDLPEGYSLRYAIGFGYPDESPEAKPRDMSKAIFLE